MQKKLLLLGCLVLFGNIEVLAEEVQETVASEDISTIVENKEEILQETVEISTEKDANTVAEINRNEKFLAVFLEEKIISQQEHDDYVLKLSNAKTIEEVENVMTVFYENNQKAMSYRWAFDERYLNLRNNIEGWQKQGKLTTEQANKFLQELDSARTLTDIQKVFEDVNAIVIGDKDKTPVTEEEIKNAKRHLNILLVNSYITEETYTQLMEELNEVKTKYDLDIIYDQIRVINPDAELFIWSFAESYLNIKSNISGSLDNGKITKEQADKLFAQLEEATTLEELDLVSKELDSLLNGTTETTTSEIKTEQKTQESGQKTLPKTGEKNKQLLRVGGTLLVMSSLSFLILRRQ